MKHLFVLIFIALEILTCYGQTNAYNIGFEGGFNFCSARGYSGIDNSYNQGIKCTAGLFFHYNLNGIISFRTGTYYEQKGASIKFNAVDNNGIPIGTFHTNEKFNFLTIPLLVRANFGNSINYFINAGPYFGLILKQTENIEAISSYPSRENDVTQAAGRNEFGLSLGLGLSYKLLKKIAFSFEARDNFGLSKSGLIPIADFRPVKTNSLNLLLGISYIL